MIKRKSWIWWLTVFANPSMTTTISPNIYVAKDFYTWPKSVQNEILRHERIHLRQQEEVGVVKFLFLYCFCFLILYNPWRYTWEYEAYTKSGTSDKQAREHLRSWYYGWLLNK